MFHINHLPTFMAQVKFSYEIYVLIFTFTELQINLLIIFLFMMLYQNIPCLLLLLLKLYNLENFNSEQGGFVWATSVKNGSFSPFLCGEQLKEFRKTKSCMEPFLKTLLVWSLISLLFVSALQLLRECKKQDWKAI